MRNAALNTVPKRFHAELINNERRFRKSGEWGQWEKVTFPPGSAGNSWAACFTTAHKNRVFSVLDRMDFSGARHLAVTSLSGIRPTWPEMQRIKDELAGPEATAVEVYPPRSELVDEADMFHIWVLPGRLQFSLAMETRSTTQEPTP